jgi:hypothetical protein
MQSHSLTQFYFFQCVRGLWVSEWMEKWHYLCFSFVRHITYDRHCLYDHIKNLSWLVVTRFWSWSRHGHDFFSKISHDRDRESWRSRQCLVLMIIFIYLKLVRYVKGMSRRITSINTLSRAQRELKMVQRTSILVTIIAAIGFPYVLNPSPQ